LFRIEENDDEQMNENGDDQNQSVKEKGAEGS
jgi:hypothetical protein